VISRRDFLRAAAAASLLVGSDSLARAAAQQRIAQEDLLRFAPLGQVTLLHLTDLHAQLLPLYFREPAVNIGAGEARGRPPHLTGANFLAAYGLPPGSPQAYAFTCADFTALAGGYGRMGGLDRIATLVKAIRAERPGQVLLLDGGDSWQGSYTTLAERGMDMVQAMRALKLDAMTGHWEFTLGAARLKELTAALGCPFLCGNVVDKEWGDPVFDSTAFFERGGVKVAVIGQAYPYVPIAHPQWLFPDWTFGIQEDRLRDHVAAARKAGAAIVVLLSHNGFDIDRKLASRVDGIDVILGGHTHDALPEPVMVGRTIVVASGSHGKFLARLDLDVANGAVAGHRFRLIPVFSDAIVPDAEMAALVASLRRPHEAEIGRVLGTTEGLLYRRGNFNGTFDDLICDALLQEREAEIALSPGFRFGATLLPGQPIRIDDLYSQTAITYPTAYRRSLTGGALKDILEDVADNLFNPDPYYQQGGDMVRVGGMSYRIDVTQPMGQRISEMRLARSGAAIEAEKSYQVAGWASLDRNAEGPPIYDLVARHIAAQKSIAIPDRSPVEIVGGDPRGMAG
jgi:sulfur-oxidizing protein SoxB